jgi:hypothetical protein
MKFTAKIISVCFLAHLSEAGSMPSKKIMTHDAEIRKADKSKVVSKDILNHSDLQVMISVFVGSN